MSGKVDENTGLLIRGDHMRKLDKQKFYSELHPILIKKYGPIGEKIWQQAADEYDKIMSDEHFRKHKGAFGIPAVVLYKALRSHGKHADRIMQRYGDYKGMQRAKALRRLTYIPFFEDIAFLNFAKILDYSSSSKKGYKRKIVSEPPQMYGVDIISCPMHEVCKELGEEKAVLCICHMDKNMSKGYRKLDFLRRTAIPEGAEYCEYRVRKKQ